MSQRVKFTGRSMRYLRLVQDYGHLDEHAIDHLLIGGWGPDPGPETVDLPEVRRSVATILFDPVAEPSPILGQDWPLLFS